MKIIERIFIKRGFLLKYFILAFVLFALLWQVSKLTYFTPTERSNDFLNSATTFYRPSNLRSALGLEVINEQSSGLTKPVVRSTRPIEKKLIELYSLPQEELGASLTSLSFYQKELELTIALVDKKIDKTLLLNPALRIAVATYLEIAPQDLTEQDLKDAEISNKIWKRIVSFSQTSDFRVLLLQGKLSKEEIEKFK